MADEGEETKAAFKRLSEMISLTADANDQECENEYELERISTQKKMIPIEANSPTRSKPCVIHDVNRNPQGKTEKKINNSWYVLIQIYTTFQFKRVHTWQYGVWASDVFERVQCV